MPTISKWQGRNSKPGLTHSKTYWLQETYVDIGKESGTLGHWAKDHQGVLQALPALHRPPFVHIPFLTCCATFPLAKLWGCSRSPEDERLVGAGDAVSMVTASYTKHKVRALGTGNGHQLHGQNPHLSWNRQDWPHIWSQVLVLIQNRKEKPRETSVSVTGLQSWKELEAPSHPRHLFCRSGNWDPGKARSHAQLHNEWSLWKIGHILLLLLLMVPLFPFSKIIPVPGSLPAPGSSSAPCIALDPRVVKGGATVPEISTGPALSFCWLFSLHEMPVLLCSLLLHILVFS